ncbi:PEP-CTERM system TPR-repeat protein PrsT [Alteromonas mediterranea]|uniref:XrtA/PEP-CTERM system TPR-repeat protein PrsT n=1 Tax=Alteromonas mediterranea TaxID=314275 RepID=UPI00113187AB|nr:XrtA/PEP-CTERM system TPR-repeat protein PrsT [Alteromonas mediterranea]QDG35614.1 PEP-CTERM system TPR-repeat protein PrsT [Alteromonas mediterranea]
MTHLRPIVLACLIITLTACGEKPFESHVSEAKTLIEKGNYKAAILEIKSAVQQQPDNAEVRLLLASSYMANGQMALAEKEFRTALELGDNQDIEGDLVRAIYLQDNLDDTIAFNTSKPLSKEATAKIAVLKSLAHLRAGDRAESLLEIDQALKLEVDTKYSALAKAIKTANTDIESAIQQIDTVLISSPLFAEALFAKGLFAAAQKQYMTAVDAMEKYVDLIPSTNVVRLYLADALTKNGQFEDAEKQANIILKKSKEQAFANQIKGIAKFQERDFEKALLHIEKAIQNGINSNSNRLIAGLSAFQLQKYEQAHNRLSAIDESLSPEHPARKILYLIQVQLGYTLDANNTLAEIENLSSKDAELLAEASYELIKLGDTQAARSPLSRLEEVADENAISMMRLGALKMTINDISGVTDLEQAVELDSNLPQAKLALAAAYVQTQNYDKAIGLAKTWINDHPKQATGYNLVGLIHSLSGNEEESSKAYQQALSIDPNNSASLLFFAALAERDGSFGKAQKNLKKVLNIRPTYLPALKLNYRVSSHLNDTADAINAIESATRELGNSHEHATLLARAYYSEGRYMDAIRILESIDKGDSSLDKRFWITLAYSHLRNGNPEKAITTIDNWSKLAPKKEAIWLHKIQLEENLQRYKDAILTVKNGLVHNPESVKLRLVEANLLAVSNLAKQAQNSLDQLPSKAKELPFFKYIQGHIYALNEKHKKALPLLLERYSAAPVLQNAKLVFITYKALNKPADAFNFFEKHIMNNPNDTSARLIVSNEYLGIDPKKAIPHYKAILKGNEKSLISLNNLAYLYHQEGSLDIADGYAELALKLAPEDPNILDTAASIKISRGEKEVALALLQKAIEIAPANIDLKKSLEKAKSL